ncbi:MAG TPA: GGDEF domain-containing protein [Planctomycetaceae bacterium]|nr:GGDEF domain-containing protein [Planctomycetaceae bacterium]
MLNAHRMWSSPQLPTLPAVALRLLELSKRPDTQIADVIAVIRSDPAICARILKSTNSSFFGLKAPVTSIDRAVGLLGTTIVTSLALSFSLAEAATGGGPLAEHYRDYWLQSVVQGVAAEVLGADQHRHCNSESFVAALLADLGRLAMLKTIGKEYLPVLEEARHSDLPLEQLEREALGIDHVEVGLKLAESWRLPVEVAEAVRFHHAPLEDLRAAESPGKAGLISTVATAAAVGEYFCRRRSGASLERLRELTQALFGMDEPAMHEYLGLVKARVDEAAALFALDARLIEDPSDLLALANEQLAELAMREHVASTQAAIRTEMAEREKRELEFKNRQLERMALRDPLTSAYNRCYFDHALDMEIERVRRCGRPVGVVFCDIDRFKQLNDTCGHPFGDLVLQRVAILFTRVTRSSDVVARYGGEEFVVLVAEPTEKGLEKLTERLRAAVEAEEFLFEGCRVPVTVSVGAALAIPRRTERELAGRLLAAADAAMYDSKHGGRNQVHVRSLMSGGERRLLQAVLRRRFSRWLVANRVFDVPTVSRALVEADTRWMRFGEAAMCYGCLDRAGVDRVLGERGDDERFGEAAIRIGVLSEDAVAQLLALQQEAPDTLAKSLVALGLLSREESTALLDRYLAESAPAPVSSPPARLATNASEGVR